MHDQGKLISLAITGLFALGLTSGTASAAENEKCFGITKAGQNACNSNINKHSCAGRARIDNDPEDFTNVPRGSCLKIGGRLEPATNNQATSSKK